MKRFISIIDWFIPHSLQCEKVELSLARNFVFTHLFGPLMSQLIIIFLHRTDPVGHWQVWTITIGVWCFWLLPVLLKLTGRLLLCAFLSVELLAFVSLFGAFHYGGATSPFLPWLIVSLLLGFFYLSKHVKLVVATFALNSVLFVLTYLWFGFSELVQPEEMEVVGWFSIISATVYMGWMANYYMSMLSMRSDLTREMEELEATTRRLEEAKTQAENANKRRSIFLAKMSHELRTPLNAVIGYSELVLENAELEGGSDQKKSDLGRINAAGKHLLSLLNEVLDISRIEKDEVDVVVENFDLASFGNDVVAGTESLVRANNNFLQFECAPRLGRARTDATKLRQATLNLIGNAAKFTTNGVITLALRRERTPIGDWIEIEVRDTGIGIAQPDIGKLFSNFTQASASTSSRFGGTGLGLAHSQSLCGLLGGRISVTSELGKGSVFTIRVPSDFQAIQKCSPDLPGAFAPQPA